MVAPRPALRISPSGPLTTGDTDPLKQYSGAFYNCVLSTDPAALPNGTTQYQGARIGPSNADTAHSEICYVARQGAPQAVVAPKQVSQYAPKEDSADFELGEGTWLVESTITLGFNSSAPAAPLKWGSLSATAQLISDANLVVGSNESTPISGIVRGVIDGTSPSAGLDGVFHTTVFRSFIAVTPAMIAANGNQKLRGVMVKFKRATGGGGLGDYDSASGWLEFSRESSIHVRRFR